MRALKRNAPLAALIGLATLVLSACAENAPQDFQQELGGPKAVDQANIFWLVFWIAVVIFFLVEFTLLAVALKYRRRKGEGGLAPAQTHGNTRLEVIWTIIPCVLLAGLAIPTVAMIWDQTGREDDPNALEIRVVGKQWWWEIHYPGTGDQVMTANEVHIPTGRTINFSLESADVIHSFWAPKLAGKQDLVPGQVTELNFKASVPGTYMGQCTEYCGLSHANMRLLVVAQTPEEFEAWVQQQSQPGAEPAAGSDAARGKEIFLSSACVGCHTIKGTIAAGTVGPNLTHFASRQRFAGEMFDNTPENVAAWLRDPPGMKPGSRMPNLKLSEESVSALVAYLESLQ